MLMAPEQQDTITGRGRQLLDALKEKGDWMSRAELARATDKNRLSPHDLTLLERLIVAGMVERRQRGSNTPIGIAFEYRAKP